MSLMIIKRAPTAAQPVPIPTGGFQGPNSGHAHFQFSKARLPTYSGKFGPPEPYLSESKSAQNSPFKSPIISPESRFESRFYRRRFGPHESPRFPDAKNRV